MEQSNAMAQSERLPRLIERAAAALAKATTAAEILDVSDQANAVYAIAKTAARLAKAKGAHDEIVATCHKAMGDVVIIEAQADCRLADEVDAAQERGELATHSPGNPKIVRKQDDLKQPATSAESGINRQKLFQARIIRDAEKANPGIVRKIVEAKLAAGQAPTRADVRRAAIPKPPSPPPSSQLRARNADQGRPTTTPAPETEADQLFDDEEDEANFGYRYARASLEGLIIGWVERSGGTKQDRRWMRVQEAQEVFEAMCDFVEDTLDLIDDGALTVTGDHKRLDEWRELKAFVELAFPIEDDGGFRLRGPRGGTP